ncbi:MAG: hypothetical protein KC766_16125 [Myxococcales bacterium]|nr:hypothetical protein [Myxococcales bacterium]
MTDLHEDKLETLGLDSSSYRALLMLPAVYVAWAGGTLTAGAAAGLEQMMQDLELNEHAVVVVRRWLRTRPTAGYVSHALAELRDLASAVDEPQIDYNLLQALLSHAEAVARAGVTNPEAAAAPWALSRTETQAIDQVSRILGVDHGQTWADLLQELGAGAEMPEPTAQRSASQIRTKITSGTIRVGSGEALGLADTVPARPAPVATVKAPRPHRDQEERDSLI